MASEFRNRAREIVSEAVLRKRDDPPQIFVRQFALKPPAVISLLLCAGVAFAAYLVYFNPHGEITSPSEGSPTARIVEIEDFTKNIPPEHQYKMVAIDVPGLGLCWPKRQIYSINDAFKTKILERGPNADFTVSLYAVPRNVHLDILEWFKDCQRTKTETGFKMISDRFKLDSITLSLGKT